jgi:hypothetical protein
MTASVWKFPYKLRNGKTSFKTQNVAQEWLSEKIIHLLSMGCLSCNILIYNTLKVVHPAGLEPATF